MKSCLSIKYIVFFLIFSLPFSSCVVEKDIEAESLKSASAISLVSYRVSGNTRNLISYNSISYLDIELKSHQMTPGKINAILSSESPYVKEIVKNSHTFEDLRFNEVTLFSRIFQFQLNDATPDNVSIPFKITFIGTEESFDHFFELKTNAPDIVLDYSLNTETVLPGDTVTLSCQLQNTGQESFDNITIDIIDKSNLGLIILNPQLTFSNLTINNPVSFNFDIEIPSSLQSETNTVPLEIKLSNDNNDLQKFYSFNLKVGTTESFESGAFSSLWKQVQLPWIITDKQFYEGKYSAKSGDIAHGETSVLSMDITFNKKGFLSFYKKVSTELNFDQLRFYINNQEIDSWSGDIDWSLEKHELEAGTHTIKWVYEKDNLINGNADSVWIDQIKFFEGNPL